MTRSLPAPIIPSKSSPKTSEIKNANSECLHPARMTLKVIGTGFGRTGTNSMREALGMLGFGPCHHMYEVNSNEAQKRLWRAFVQGAPTGWDELV